VPETDQVTREPNRQDYSSYRAFFHQVNSKELDNNKTPRNFLMVNKTEVREYLLL
jgi:hypothetical protein